MKRLKSSGYTLLAIIVLIAILSVLAMLGMSLVTSEFKNSHTRTGSMEALYASEAGVNDVINRLNSTMESEFIGVGSSPVTEPISQVSMDSARSYSGSVTMSRIDASNFQAEINITGKSITPQTSAQRVLKVTVRKSATSQSTGPIANVAMYTGQNLNASDFTSFFVKGADTWSDGDMNFTSGTTVDLDKANGKKANYYGNFPNQSGSGFSGWFVTPNKVSSKQNNGAPNMDTYKNIILGKMNVVNVRDTIPTFTPVAPTPGGPGVIILNGDTTVSKTLVEYNGNVWVKGNLTVNCTSFLVHGYLYVEGNLSPNCTSATIDSYLYVRGNLTNNSNFTVNDYMYIEGNLTNNSRFTIKSYLYDKGILTVNGNSFIVNGNVYTGDNFIVGSPSSFTVGGYILTEGGMRVQAPNTISSNGIYLKGTKPYFDGSQPQGSFEINYAGTLNNNYKDIYVKGNFIGRLGNIYVGNIQVDGSKLTLSGGTSGVVSGSIYVPSGDLSLSGTTFQYGDARVGGSVSVNGGTTSYAKSIYADGSISWSGTTITTTQGADNDFYSGGQISLSGTTASINGMLVSNGGINLTNGTSFYINQYKLPFQSGIITSGPLAVKTFTTFSVNGLIWSGGQFTLCGGGSALLSGEILSAQFITQDPACVIGGHNRAFTTFWLTYDWQSVSSFASPGGGSQIGPVTVVDWKEQQ